MRNQPGSRSDVSRKRPSILLLRLLVPVALGPMTACSPTPIDSLEQEGSTLTDDTSPAGVWYLRTLNPLGQVFRLRMSISQTGGLFSGTIANEGGADERLSSITWNSATRWLEFQRNGPGFVQWFRVSVVQGVLAGRYVRQSAGAKPALTAFDSHVTGWSPTYLDKDIVPRAWNLTINGSYAAVLRVDRDGAGTLVGRLKVFDNTSAAGPQEELEADLTGLSWDGTTISFTRLGPGFVQRYTGTASGRSMSGSFTHNGGPPGPWSGTRGEVLGFGLGSRSSVRDTWQSQTRDRLGDLTEGMRTLNAGNPMVSAAPQTCAACPLATSVFWGERDDNPTATPANYTLKMLQLSFRPPNRFDPANAPPARQVTAFLATPSTAPPPGGYRAIVVANGHFGSAQQTMTADSQYWYGESAARNGFVVLAVDVGHRPEENFPGVQSPAIVGSNYATSDWEEEGERAYTIGRAIDFLGTVPNVRTDRIFMMGLSMGGEVTTITSALDPRIALAVVAGYSPDMNVMDANGNHRCYQWRYADIHEYLDVSDYESMIAPRPLVVETGLADNTFSQLPTPFAADKQVLRRARAAYGADSARLIHYLHYDGHNFHVGDVNPSNASRPRNVVQASVVAPTAAGDQSWQTDGSTTFRSLSLYALMDELLP